jgi:predicted lipase
MLTKTSTGGVTQAMVNEFKHVSEWAAAAYCKPQQGKSGGKVSCGKAKICDSVERLNTKIYETWIGKGKNGATGFVARDTANKKIYLSMRGSVNMANWAADVKYFMTDCANDLKIANAKCEVGFYGFWKESQEYAVSGVRQAMAENPGYRIIVTGHSLGGAAAVYGAAYLRTKYPNVTMVCDEWC